MKVLNNSNGSNEIVKMLRPLSLMRFESAFLSLVALLRSPSEQNPQAQAQNVVLRFTEATCSIIGNWMEGIKWATPDAKLYLSPQYVTPYIILTVVLPIQ